MKNPTITIQDPHEQDSMTLRDYFAAKAMQAVIGKYNGSGVDSYDIDKEDEEAIAHYSYSLADAMLKAREQ